MKTDLRTVEQLAAREHHLAVVATTRADGTVQSSVVNAGLTRHPVSDEPVLAFVAYGTMKKAHLRERPQITLTFRAGWEWAAVEGRADLVGPDDPMEGVDAERLRLLLREIFTAAGGQHENWDAYDREMARQRRTAVLVHPRRIYSN